MYISSRINLNISNEFIQKLLRLPIRFFDSSSQGEILQKLQDTDRIEKYIMSFPMTIFSIFNLIIFSVILLYFNYIIFLTFFLFSIIYIVWIILFLKKRKEIEFKRFDQSSGNSSSLLQILNGIQEIKINGSENRRKNGWEEIRILSYKTSIKGNEIRQLQTIGSNVINELKNILISFISAYSVIKGDITLGMMMSIQYIIGQLNVPLLSFVQFISDNQDAKLSMKRIKEVESEIEEDSDTNDDIINIHNESIFVENVSFKYGNDKSNNVLEDINFVIPKGKVTAIVGESGSGKTTLVKLLLGMYDIQEGKILIGNYNLKNLNKKLWRKNCGVVMQNGYIFVDTIERNITESEQNIYISKDNLLKAVQMANIEEMIESLPMGYKTIIGPSGSSGVNISGGQAQRILIARALYKNPDYLILDEATSALDSNNEKIILESFQKLFNNKTVVVIAHRLSTVKNADNIIVLHRGKIVEQGNHEELLEKKGKYYNLVINQLQISN